MKTILLWIFNLWILWTLIDLSAMASDHEKEISYLQNVLRTHDVYKIYTKGDLNAETR